MSSLHRSANAVWTGTLREGSGSLSSDSGKLNDLAYTFISRFEKGEATNPEELIAAAHAGCFSMALGSRLGKQGFTVHHIDTKATIELTQPEGTGWQITKIILTTTGKVEGIDAAAFAAAAEETKKTCIVSKALAAIPMEITATLG
ncbi:MAG TPA: OsmC family peroxiredoxin [Aggregatilineales bacterium]|nr:OsmC family peroxiredoxin [Anaerolineales bacterium]HRE48754.1 OsmC family peroxiredoxin [Aggregatilineales bacterium]